MPYMDSTGPRGKGPRTGRGLGRCDPSIPIDQIESNRSRVFGGRQRRFDGSGGGRRLNRRRNRGG